MTADPSDDRRRLELVRFILGPDMAGLPASTRERALSDILGSAGAAPPRERLIEWLEECATPETGAAARRARAQECEDAVTAHDLRRAGRPVPAGLAARLGHLPVEAPLGWSGSRLGEAISLLADEWFLDRWGPGVPGTRALVAEALRERLAALAVGVPALLAEPAPLIDALLAGGERSEPFDRALEEAREAIRVAERTEEAAARAALAGDGTLSHGPRALAQVAESLRSTRDPEARRSLLDSLLAWPTPDVVPVLLEACGGSRERGRAMAVLSLRFGKRLGPDWTRWAAWLGTQTPVPVLDRARGLDLDPALLLLVRARLPGSAIEGLASALEARCRARAPAVLPAHFLERWADRIPPDEARVIGGRPPRPRPAAAPVAPLPPAPAAAEGAPLPLPPPLPVPPPPTPASPAAATTATVPSAGAPAPPAGAASPGPPPPDPWRGFLAENANLLAGIAMLLVGGSLVAYFTWDRHWLFRYTIVPGLFAAFTGGLAAVARWLEKSDPDLAGTAAMLRGAAIALLPANCMSVSLLADDPLVTHKLFAVPAMAALYLVLLMIGLRRWCGAVHVSLGRALAPGLLFLNALVLVRPLARALARLDEFELLDVLTVGFYLGFAAVALVAGRFVSRVLTREMAEKPRIAWFAGGTLLLTYLQVFVWVHAWERALPPVAVYGPLVVLAGGLAFYVERRFRLVLGLASGAGEESFVGFTLILLGLLAAFGSPVLRIAAFVLAGLLWLYQARFRSSPLHDYVGLLLLVLGGASVALLDSFPRPLLAALGLVLCAGIGLAALAAARVGADRTREAAHEMQQALLVLTAVTAALTQWHFRSEPVWTAGALAAAAAMLLVRAVRHDSARDAFIGAMVAALALPYLGFADMRGQRFLGNTLVMGLAVLSLVWLAGLRLTRARPLVEVRSTVLFVYGALALTAMAARVLFERQVPPSPSLALSFPEYLGPVLMLGVLVWATFLSRSMAPLIAGLAMVVAMLPAMKADFRLLFPAVAWGTGYGSAVAALLLLVTAFHLRWRPDLAALGEGDAFFGGGAFPLRRHDHALFTTPIVAAALFLLLRVDTYTVLRNLGDGPPLRTAAAVVLTAVGWTLLGAWARDRPAGVVAVNLGFVVLLGGLVLGKRQWGDPGAFEWPLLLAGLTLQAAEGVYRAWVVPRHPWADGHLAAPTRRALRGASAVVAAGIVVALLAGHDAPALRLLTAFVLLELGRFAIREDATVDGSIAVGLGLVALLAETAPGHGRLLDRLGWGPSVFALLGFASGVHVLLLLLEARPAAFRRLSPLLEPARTAAAAITLGLGVVALATAVPAPHLGAAQQWMVVANALLLARWALPGPSLLLAALVADLGVRHPVLAAAADAGARWRVLADPVPVATFALALGAVVATGRRGPAVWRRWAQSPMAVPALLQPRAPWLLGPAVALAAFATLRHSAFFELRGLAAETPAPYLAAAALVLAAVEMRSAAVAWMAAAALTTGNVHALRLAAGDLLRARGLSDLHLLALGAAATLVQATLLRPVARARAAADFLRQVVLAAAALVLTLLAGNYAADPDLQDFTSFRFLVSGALALAAGLHFRRPAVHPQPDEERYVGYAYAVYHFGVALALWCFVLLVPWLRHPATALPALAVPVAYFMTVAERFCRRGDARAVRYARSAVVTALAVLGMYVARPLFQLALFPEAVVRTDHYHTNAPLVVLLGVALLRLHALERRVWVAFVGGITLMVGVYFGLTGWPALSPFDTRFPAAWAGVALAHAFAWLGKSPRWRAWWQRWAGVDDASWERLALGWHLTAFFGALDLAMVAVSHHDVGAYGWGALLGAVASILLEGSWQRPAVSFATAVLSTVGVAEAVLQPSLLSEIGLLAVAVGAARVAAGPFLLVAWADAYVLAQHVQLAGAPALAERWAVLTSPWRLGALSVGLSLTVELARRLAARAVPGRTAASSDVAVLPWVGGPAALVALLAALTQTLDPSLRVPPAQLWTAYLAAAAHGLVALSPGAAGLAWSAAGLLSLANIHVLHRYGEGILRAHGLDGIDELALGVTAMLVVTRMLRARAWSAGGAWRLALIRGAYSLAVIALLVASYVWHGGLAAFGPERAWLTGAMAVVAAEALRALARWEGVAAGEALETSYHAATSMAIVAFALLAPALRAPRLALLTLCLPAAYLWARSELAGSLGAGRGARYRDSATAAAGAVLALAASRWLFAAILFPQLVVTTRHYHTQAPVVLILGLLLLRLHGLGAPYAVAVCGAMATVAGSYLGVTAWPGLSPFTSPLAGTWVAIAVVHAWTLATTSNSSVTSVVRAFAGLGESGWNSLRATVGQSALVAAHLLGVAALVHPGLDSRAVAPLLLGLASLLAHHGVLRASGAYFDLAAVEVLLALHADAWVPSDLRLGHVVWVLLALRAVLAVVASRPLPVVARARVEVWGAVCAVLVVAHVFHHRPWSTEGLWAAAGLAVTTALVPRVAPVVRGLAERLVVLLLVAMPTWLVHFASAPWAEAGPRALVATEPLLRTLAAFLLTGLAAREVPLWAGTSRATPVAPRAFHQVLSFLASDGDRVLAWVLHGASAAAVALLAAHYGRAYAARELVLALAILATLAVSWYRRGRRRASWAEVLVAEGFAAAAFGLLRRQLLLTTNVWTYEYDLWLSLAASALLTGAKQRLERRRVAPEVNRPVTLSLLLMPALAITWTLTHHLGSDMVLLVVGLNSVLFAFLGHDRRDSPYNLVAVSGFVAFVLVVFWSRLQLRVVHAYVVPLGIGVLLLLQLFESELKAEARARIRLVTLAAMLGSTAYSALLDVRHPLAFNLALLLLCLGCMAVGSLLRIRLYVGLGLSFLLLDLVSLAVKALARMESQARMTWVGVAVFLVGALVVAMGVYHKARRRDLEDLWSRWRAAFGSWQ